MLRRTTELQFVLRKFQTETLPMTRDSFNNALEADAARSGIHYVALKLEDELNILCERAAESRAAWERERPQNWQRGPPEPAQPEA